MKLRWRAGACLLLCGLLAWFLADAGEVRAATAAGLALCGRSVIPALFPFMAASTMLVSLGFGEWASPRLVGLMNLYRLPGPAGSALLLGLVGGYPIGARTDGPEPRRLSALGRSDSPRFPSPPPRRSVSWAFATTPTRCFSSAFWEAASLAAPGRECISGSFMCFRLS